MTQKNKVGKWAETAFQFDSELWRTKTTEDMIVRSWIVFRRRCSWF